MLQTKIFHILQIFTQLEKKSEFWLSMHFAMAAALKRGDLPWNSDPLFLLFPGHPLHARLKAIKKYKLKTSWNKKFFFQERGRHQELWEGEEHQTEAISLG